MRKINCQHYWIEIYLQSIPKLQWMYVDIEEEILTNSSLYIFHWLKDILMLILKMID